MRRKFFVIISLMLVAFSYSFAQISESYKTFKVAVYARAYEVRQIHLNDMET